MIDGSGSISVVLCALNEEQNIERVLSSLDGQQVSEVILVDGGSRDRTIELAKKVRPDVRILEHPGEGLLRQRLWGIKAAQGALLLLLDADDELEVGSVDRARRHIEDNRLDGSQFGFLVDDRTRWSRIWSQMLIVSSPEGEVLPMIGRPALVVSSLYAGIDPAAAPRGIVATEDSFIRSAYERLTRPRFAAGPGRTLRLQPTRLGEIVGKGWAYGRGDADQALRFGQFGSLAHHLLWRYPVIRGRRALAAFGPQTAFLCATVGVIRYVSAVFALLRSLSIGLFQRGRRDVSGVPGA